MTQSSRVMQSADRRDYLAMLFERLERTRELVILARRRNLIVERMHSVGEVNEGTTSWRSGLLLGSSKRHHALEERQRNTSAHGTQGVSAVDEPGLGEEVHGRSGFGIWSAEEFRAGEEE